MLWLVAGLQDMSARQAASTIQLMWRQYLALRLYVCAAIASLVCVLSVGAYGWWWRRWWWFCRHGGWSPANSALLRRLRVAHSEALKVSCNRMRRLRLTTRLPLCEAIYNGHAEVSAPVAAIGQVSLCVFVFVSRCLVRPSVWVCIPVLLHACLPRHPNCSRHSGVTIDVCACRPWCMQAVELLFRRGASVGMVTRIAPDAIFPYRMLRAIPRDVVVPVFNADGSVVNVAEVDACAEEIDNMDAIDQQGEPDGEVFVDDKHRIRLLREGVDPVTLTEGSSSAVVVHRSAGSVHSSAGAGAGTGTGTGSATHRSVLSATVSVSVNDLGESMVTTRTGGVVRGIPVPPAIVEYRATRAATLSSAVRRQLPVARPDSEIVSVTSLGDPEVVADDDDAPVFTPTKLWPSAVHHGGRPRDMRHAEWVTAPIDEDSFTLDDVIGGIDGDGGAVAHGFVTPRSAASFDSPVRGRREGQQLPESPDRPGSVLSDGAVATLTPERDRDHQIAPHVAEAKADATNAAPQCFRIVETPLSPLQCASLGYYHFHHKVWRTGDRGWTLLNSYPGLVARSQQFARVCACAALY